MKSATIVAIVGLMLGLGIVGCKSSHNDEVTSDYMSQWTDVAANTEKTTAAAKVVLEGESFKDVTAESTAVDGKATAKLADGTKVNVTVKKKSDTISEVSVKVGAMGEPKLGANLVTKIRAKAAGK